MSEPYQPSGRRAGLQTLVRNRYFYGQLLGVYYFELETDYFIRQRSLLRRLILPRGQVGVQVHVEGTNINHDATADLGQGIQVTDSVVADDGTAMDLTVTVADSAQPGARDLTITNPDCSIATSTAALTVASQTIPKTAKSAAPKRRRPRQAP